MKSLINKTVERAAGQALAILLTTTTIIIMITAIPAAVATANAGGWSLDSSASSARLYLGSKTDPDSVNVGVARVTGTVDLDIHHVNNSVFNLSIYPSGEDWGKALTPEGNLPTGYVPDASDDTLLTFRSKRSVLASDGSLRVTGDLTLTRVERSVMADPSEAYAGPVYGDPVIHTSTEEVTFVFPSLSTALAPGSLPPGTREKKAVLEVSASTRIAHEDFRELPKALMETNWPSVVANEHCEVPSVGEDFHGPVCSGTVIAATRADNCHAPATIGEDYSGPICNPPAGDQTRIVLHLQLTNANLRQPAEALPGTSAAQ